MTTNQKVWIISAIILLICLLLTLIIYLNTGQIFIAILIAPPLIHYAIKFRNKRFS